MADFRKEKRGFCIYQVNVIVTVQSQQVLTSARDSGWLNYEERRHGNEAEDANRIRPHSTAIRSPSLVSECDFINPQKD
jgi:hypothetical protein